jgi:tetratricopeptide (TPR) repeat protein
VLGPKAMQELGLKVGKLVRQLAKTTEARRAERQLGVIDQEPDEVEFALGMLGREEGGTQVLQEALPLAEAGGDLAILFLTLTNLGGAAGDMGRVEQMRQYMERALAVAERIGNPLYLCFSLCTVGMSLFALGEWQEARQVLQRCEPLVRKQRRGREVAIFRLSLGELTLREGDWDEASRILEDSLSVAQETGHQQGQERAQIFLAELDVLTGRPEEAIKQLEPLVKEGSADLTSSLSCLAWAHVCINDEKHLQQAAETAERAVNLAQGHAEVLVSAVWVQGMVLIRQGCSEEALRVLTAGLALTRSMPYPYWEACILEQLGILAQQRADPEQAQARLEEALAIFRRLGAKNDIERTEQTQVVLDRTTDPAS